MKGVPLYVGERGEEASEGRIPIHWSSAPLKLPSARSTRDRCAPIWIGECGLPDVCGVASIYIGQKGCCPLLTSQTKSTSLSYSTREHLTNVLSPITMFVGMVNAVLLSERSGRRLEARAKSLLCTDATEDIASYAEIWADGLVGPTDAMGL